MSSANDAAISDKLALAWPTYFGMGSLSMGCQMIPEQGNQESSDRKRKKRGSLKRTTCVKVVTGFMGRIFEVLREKRPKKKRGKQPEQP